MRSLSAGQEDIRVKEKSDTNIPKIGHTQEL